MVGGVGSFGMGREGRQRGWKEEEEEEEEEEEKK